MKDISEQIDPFDIPCCPMCDQPIEIYHEAILVQAHGNKFTVHSFCLKDDGWKVRPVEGK